MTTIYKTGDKFTFKADAGLFEIIGIHPAGQGGRTKPAYIFNGLGRLTLSQDDVDMLLEKFDPLKESDVQPVADKKKTVTKRKKS